jgi:putative inorganic carbon (HCO3(-)) transporter
MTASRSSSPVALFLVLSGAVVGVVVSKQPALALLGLVAVGIAMVGVMYPTTLVVGMMTAVLFDRVGATGFAVAQLPVTASKLSVLGGLGLWAVHVVLSRATPVRWHPVLGAMLGVVTMTAVSVAIANCMAVGKYTLFGMAMMTVLVGFVYTVLAEAELQSLFRFLAVALIALFLLSLAPSAGGRASGTFGDPNEWATMVLLLTPAALGGLAGDRSPWARPLRVLLVLLAPMAVLRTGSRTAFVVLMLVLPACLYLLRRHRWELVFSAVAAASVAPFVMSVSATIDRLRSLLGNLQGSAVIHDVSLNERTELLHQGMDLFRDHWFLGSGPGTFARATGFLSTYGEFRPAHNTYLEVASEQGVVGLIPFAVFFAMVAHTLWRGYRAAQEPAAQERVLGVSIGLAAVALMAGTLGLLTFSMAYLVLGLGLVVAAQARGTHVQRG